ncbi:nuclear transport factor 2 family protein [Olivibacter sitiensis]|uniref:nuclear transport factor 2 family protein n=1 Tax=Olivibacter sitiensis TaxID=376470 RepID=UPI0004813A26|nr:nuclear transport factor 2 family protein [Olivibacter sitiensis]
MQTITSISRHLIQLLRNQQFVKAYEDLFSEDAESIDPINPRPEPLKGLSRLIEVEKLFLSKVEIYNIEISEAIHAENYFTIRFFIAFLIDGKKRNIDELCVYKVSQGKIISQQFFVS